MPDAISVLNSPTSPFGLQSSLPGASAAPTGYAAQVAQLATQQDKSNADLQARRSAETAPLLNSATDTMAQREAMPGPATVPLPENKAHHLDPKVLNDTAGLMMTLGGLAGLVTRAPLTAALNNMTAVMKGVQEGDEAQYDHAYKEFETNFKKAMETNREAIAEYTRVMNDKSKTIQEKIDLYNIVDRKYGNELLINSKTFDSRFKVIYAMEKQSDKLQSRADLLEHWHQKDMDRRNRLSAAQAHRYTPIGVDKYGNVVAMDAQTGQTMAMPGVKPKAGGAGSGQHSAINQGRAAIQTDAVMRLGMRLDNIVTLPSETMRGVFGDLATKHGTGLASALQAMAAQKITPTASRMLDQMAKGIEAELSSLERSGMGQQGVTLMRELQGMRPQAGDNEASMALWLAEIKQFGEVAQRSLQTWPGVTEGQLKQVQDAVDEMRRVVPWTVKDVTKHIRGDQRTVAEKFSAMLTPDALLPDPDTPVDDAGHAAAPKGTPPPPAGFKVD